MPVVSYPEQNQIMAKTRLAASRGQKFEITLVFLRGQFRLNLAADPEHRFFGDLARNKQRLARHAKIALRIVRRHTAFVAKSEIDLVPRQIARNPRELGVDRTRRVPAREGDTELAAFSESGQSVFQDEHRGVVHEVPGANDLALHGGPALDRAM